MKIMAFQNKRDRQRNRNGTGFDVLSWKLHTLPGTLHALHPPGGIMSSEPVNYRIVNEPEVMV